MTDIEAITLLQQHNRKAETRFYESMLGYFGKYFHRFFFDEDRRQEVFQAAFIKLWTEIENKTITVIDGSVCRLQRATGRYAPMTASLSTFMMAFARNEFREILRNVKEDNYEELFETAEGFSTLGEEPDETEALMQVIDECLLRMSDRCREILTLFYYEHKTLDEIMTLRGDQHSSKDGLKTAKNKCMNSLREKARVTLAHNDL